MNSNPTPIFCKTELNEENPELGFDQYDFLPARRASFIVAAICLFSSFASKEDISGESRYNRIGSPHPEHSSGGLTSLAKREKIGIGFEFMRDAAAQTAVANALGSVAPKFDSDPDFRSSFGSKLLISEIV